MSISGASYIYNKSAFVEGVGGGKCVFFLTINLHITSSATVAYYSHTPISVHRSISSGGVCGQLGSELSLAYISCPESLMRINASGTTRHFFRSSEQISIAGIETPPLIHSKHTT